MILSVFTENWGQVYLLPSRSLVLRTQVELLTFNALGLGKQKDPPLKDAHVTRSLMINNNLNEKEK